MATSKAQEKLRKQLVLQKCCRENYFTRMQRLYDDSKSISDSALREIFVSNCQTIDQIRSDFRQCVNDINAIQMDLDPDYKPDFSTWSSFEDLYCQVIRVKN